MENDLIVLFIKFFMVKLADKDDLLLKDEALRKATLKVLINRLDTLN